MPSYSSLWVIRTPVRVTAAAVTATMPAAARTNGLAASVAVNASVTNFAAVVEML